MFSQARRSLEDRVQLYRGDIGRHGDAESLIYAAAVDLSTARVMPLKLLRARLHHDFSIMLMSISLTTRQVEHQNVSGVRQHSFRQNFTPFDTPS